MVDPEIQTTNVLTSSQIFTQQSFLKLTKPKLFINFES